MTEEKCPGRLGGFPGASAENLAATSAMSSVAPRHSIALQIRHLSTEELREQAYMLERVTPSMFAACRLRLRAAVHELMLRWKAGARL